MTHGQLHRQVLRHCYLEDASSVIANLAMSIGHSGTITQRNRLALVDTSAEREAPPERGCWRIGYFAGAASLIGVFSTVFSPCLLASFRSRSMRPARRLARSEFLRFLLVGEEPVIYFPAHCVLHQQPNQRRGNTRNIAYHFEFLQIGANCRGDARAMRPPPQKTGRRVRFAKCSKIFKGLKTAT